MKFLLIILFSSLFFQSKAQGFPWKKISSLNGFSGVNWNFENDSILKVFTFSCRNQNVKTYKYSLKNERISMQQIPQKVDFQNIYSDTNLVQFDNNNVYEFSFQDASSQHYLDSVQLIFSKVNDTVFLNNTNEYSYFKIPKEDSLTVEIHRKNYQSIYLKLDGKFSATSEIKLAYNSNCYPIILV